MTSAGRRCSVQSPAETRSSASLELVRGHGGERAEAAAGDRRAPAGRAARRRAARRAWCRRRRARGRGRSAPTSPRGATCCSWPGERSCTSSAPCVLRPLAQRSRARARARAAGARRARCGRTGLAFMARDGTVVAPPCASPSTPARPTCPPTCAPIAGGAGAELLELTSADGTRFSAALAEAPEPSGRAVVILPDVRGLYPFYSELAERFAAGRPPRDRDRLLRPHRRARPARRGLRVHAARRSRRAPEHGAGRRRGGAGRAARAHRRRARPSRSASASAARSRSSPRRTPSSTSTAWSASTAALSPERWGEQSPIHRARRACAARCSGSSAAPTRASRPTRSSAFERSLAEAGVEHEIVIYPGAPHSFFDRRFEEHAEACEDAWRRVLAFL